MGGRDAPHASARLPLPAAARPPGDQGLCCRAADFRAVGCYRAALPLMEDAELCLDLHNAGPLQVGGWVGAEVSMGG